MFAQDALRTCKHAQYHYQNYTIEECKKDISTLAAYCNCGGPHPGNYNLKTQNSEINRS